MKFSHAVLLVGLLAPIPLHASSYVLVADEPLARQAELIARVQILGQRASSASGVLSTYYDVAVEELVKGAFSGSRLEVRVPGGRAEGRELVLHGVPTFARGQRSLLFLRENADGTYRVLHLLQGAFREVVDRSNREVLVRDLAEQQQLVEGDDGIELQEPGRDRDRFVEWLQAVGDGRRRPADYYVPWPARGDVELTASFTRLTDKTPVRWFEFDAPAPREVLWFRHENGQRGLAGGGKAEFNRALAVWREQTNVPIRLIDAGTTTSTSGFDGLDSRNTILFEDFSGMIEDDYDCETGGVVAVGGVSGYYTDTRPWKNEQYGPVVEAEIIVNNGAECLFERAPKLAAQVYAHELGHTLGLGHACGDSRSPKCSTSAMLNESLMRSYTHRNKGAQLSDDDIVGARFLYDPEYFAVPCDLPPGHRKFCKRCGPCGFEQGNCRNDGQCLQGLECTKRVGNEFGFKPRVNVCLPSG